MMDQNFEIQILWFLRIFWNFQKGIARSLCANLVHYGRGGAAKLDQSRVLVTKFRQNWSTFKGGSAGQRHTDRQTRLKIMAFQVCNRAKKQQHRFLGSLVVDEERRLVGVSALSFLQCFGWLVTGGTSSACKTSAIYLCPEQTRAKMFYRVNLAQIRSGVLEIFRTQTKRVRGSAKNRTLRISLCAVVTSWAKSAWKMAITTDTGVCWQHQLQCIAFVCGAFELCWVFPSLKVLVQSPVFWTTVHCSV